MPNGRSLRAPEMTDGDKFRALRERAGLSQARAAKLCDVDPSTIFRWEKGIQTHSHRAKNVPVARGLDLLRWAAEKREATGCTCNRVGCAHVVSIAEMILETARRTRLRRVS